MNLVFLSVFFCWKRRWWYILTARRAMYCIHLHFSTNNMLSYQWYQSLERQLAMCLYLQSTISLLKGYYKPYQVTYYSEDGRIVQPIKCICRTKQNTARFQCSKFEQDDRKYGMQIFYAGGRHTKRGRHLFMANSCFCILKHIE